MLYLSTYPRKKGFCLPGKRKFLLLFVIPFIILFPVFLIATTNTLEEGKRLFQEEKYKEAKAVLEQVIKSDPRNHEAYFILGKIYMFEKNYDKSVEYAIKAVELKSSISEYHLWLGRSYLSKAMNSGKIKALFTAKKAKGEFEKAVELDSANIEATAALFEYCFGAPGIAGGDKQKAKKLAEIIYSKNHLLGAQYWAAFWEKEGNLDKAEAYLREAVELDTSSTFQVSYDLGSFLQRNKKYDKSVVIFEDILTKNPKDINALYQLGKTYVLAKSNLEKAEDCFKRYLEVEPPKDAPTWAGAHWRLGMVYDLQGKKELALMELKKAVELEPNDKQFKKTLKEVQKKK